MKLYMFHCQNKFVKLVHLVSFIIRKFVTMHGHMNVKLRITSRHIKVCGMELLTESPNMLQTNKQINRKRQISEII